MTIDKWIIRNELIFDSESIYNWGLTRESSFGEIRTKTLYGNMQKYLVKKADDISKEIGKEFYVIYFDVFWGNRLKMPGGNLFGARIGGNQENTKENMRNIEDFCEYNPNLSDFEASQIVNNDTPYPTLVNIFINELEKAGIYLKKDYKCIKNNDGGYIFEAMFPRGRRKSIITIWPNKHGGGDIRIVGIGKYESRRRFDLNDIGTSMLGENLFEAYRNTQ